METTESHTDIMNKAITHLLALAFLAATALLTAACSEETVVAGQPGATGKPVEVTIPFGLGKGIATTINTRAAGTDSQLSGIMVFVYEKKDDPADCRRIGWHLFSAPNSNLENSTGGWQPIGNDSSKGKIKFHMPEGECYIFLLGNATGSFLQFFPGLEAEGGIDRLATLADFLEYGKPKWTGNMYDVDGYLPLMGKVNNRDGACTVKNDGSGNAIITYVDDLGAEHTLGNDDTDITEENAFVLKRLMSKVTVNIAAKEGVTFTPKDYRFCNLPTYVPFNESAGNTGNGNVMTDSDLIPFATQSRNSLTVYLPENLHTATIPVADFAAREAVQTNPDGTNKTDNNGHYLFTNAPAGATYLEIYGHYEGPGLAGADNVSADTHYFIHLGDFGKDMQDFSLKRDYYYTFNITVNGVNSIFAEVSNGNEAPGAESIIFEGGVRAMLDAHYEQVEMLFEKNKMRNGVYIYANTPYGRVNGMYDPQSHTITSGTDKETILGNTDWITFRKQTGKGTLATYRPNEVKNVFETIDEFWAGSDEAAYYTCFVNEYFYETRPGGDKVTPMPAELSEFVNAEDRSFSIGSELKFSPDGKSAVASAVYVLQQRSIATFYDLENHTRNLFGVETVDETGKMFYGNPANSSAEQKKGRDNTLAETRSNRNSVNWEKNGWLLSSDNSRLENTEKQRLATQQGYLASLTRNRDQNGNGTLEDDEIRWYTPALHQVIGLWIGEPSMPSEAALYTGVTTAPDAGTAEKNNHAVYTSTNGNGREIWAIQGCSFGGINSDNTGNIRAVRNLGSNSVQQNSHTQVADPYYYYNANEHTIEVFLASTALRAYSRRELAPHHERSEINRPYRKFQVAKQPYTKPAVSTCTGHGLPTIGHSDTQTQNYNQLQIIDSYTAKQAMTTKAAEYPGNGEAPLSNATWRLPNQRELALMVVAMYGGSNNELGYYEGSDGNDFTKVTLRTHSGNRYGGYRWEYNNERTGDQYSNYFLHCRTTFSNASYDKPPHGYVYNVEQNVISMCYPAAGNSNCGQGTNTSDIDGGYGGCYCVRDVAQ